MRKGRRLKTKNRQKVFFLEIRKRINSTRILGLRDKFIRPIFTGVIYRRVINLVQRRPLTFFIISLLALFILIALSQFIFKAVPKEETYKESIREVSIYGIGAAPRLTVQAKIEKSGVITISAQTPGAVQQIHVQEGDHVKKGQLLVSLSTNYQGGSAPSIQRQIAANQYKNIKETFDTQKDLINKQKDLASKNDQNSDKLREISNQSISETNSLIDLNQDIISTLETNQRQYEATNSAGINNQLILQTKQIRSQFQSANNQLRGSVRQTEYSSSSSNPPAEVSDIQREIALKQLEIQEKALELNKEVSRLQLVLAQVNEGVMFPVSVCPGLIQKVHVRVGQLVTPGTPLITMSTDYQNVDAVALVPNHVAKSISYMEASTLNFRNGRLDSFPSFVSTEATDKGLYSVVFNISEEFAASVPDGGFITVEIPVGYPDTGSAVPFIPIDSIFQTEDESYIYIAEGEKAIARTVQLGVVLGGFVEVKSGLKSGDQVILTRNVIGGEKVKVN